MTTRLTTREALNPASSRQTRGCNHKALLKLVTDYLDTLPCWYAKLAGGAYQKPGLPDLIAGIHVAGCQGAQLLAIEIKTGTAFLTPKQEGVRSSILAAQGIYFVVRSRESLEAQLLAAGLLHAPRLMDFGG